MYIMRNNGVSGLLRVKNDAQFLDLCIDSCIDALDELIIVYQDCCDNSEEIIKQKALQYPDKIKFYHYEYPIRSHNLSEEEFKEVSSLPDNSPNLLASYYNYTLSKSTFKYAIKIDGDQIYNSEKLKKFCNAYKATTKVRISFKEKIAGYFIIGWSFFINNFYRIFKHQINYLPSIKLANIYSTYILKRIQNEKIPTSFNGINLFFENGKWKIPLGNYAQNTFPPFNGVYDHILFKVTADTYYVPCPIKSEHAQYNNCVIERFSLNDTFHKPLMLSPNLAHGGFLWYHVAPLKKNYYNNNYSKYILITEDLSTNIPKNALKQSLKNKLFDFSRQWFRLFWRNYHTSTKEAAIWKNNLQKIKDRL